MKVKLFYTFLFALVFCANATNGFAQNQLDTNELIKVVASDRVGSDQYGYSVSISGDYAIVGARYQDLDENGSNSKSAAGAAYILKRTSSGQWAEIKKIVASDRDIDDYFGYSVSISGDYAVVGAEAEDHDEAGTNYLTMSGSAYVFKKNSGGTDNWGQIKKLTASNREASDHFGFSVAISGDYILIGAPQEDEDEAESNTLSSAGSAYLFKKNQGGTDNWGLLKKIVASDRAISDNYGSSVAMDGNYAVVGAKFEDHDVSGANFMSNSGSAYVYFANSGGTDNWGQQKKICASDRAADDRFGYSVSISGDYIAASAYTEDHDENGLNLLSNSGAAYIFYINQGGTNNWGQQRKIVAPDREASDFFGYSIALNSGNVVVGSLQDDQDASNSNFITASGSAYIYNIDTGGTSNWGFVKKLVASDRAASDWFGQAVAICNGDVLIGSLSATDQINVNSSSTAGAGYFYQLDNVVSPTVGDFTVSTDCPTISGSKWHSLFSSNGLSFSINPKGNNMGSTCWAERVTNNAKRLIDISPNTDNGFIFDKNIYLNPTNNGPYSPPVLLRFYFTQDQLDDFILHRDASATLNTTTRNQYLNDSLKITQSLGGTTDLDPTNNQSKTNSLTTITQVADMGGGEYFIEISVTSFSEIIPGMVEGRTSTPLPVELLYFMVVQKSQEMAMAEWTVSQEMDNDYFTLEKSIDGMHWDEIGEITGRGYASTMKNYNFPDYNLSPGISYYKLTQTDFDGKKEVLGIKVLDNATDESKLMVYPNPSHDASLIIEASTRNSSSIRMTNMHGMEIPLIVRKLGDERFAVDILTLPVGVYIISIEDEYQRTRALRFVKN